VTRLTARAARALFQRRKFFQARVDRCTLRGSGSQVAQVPPKQASLLLPEGLPDDVVHFAADVLACEVHGGRYLKKGKWPPHVEADRVMTVRLYVSSGPLSNNTPPAAPDDRPLEFSPVRR